jgi:2'-5' RNA ligase
MIRAFVALPLPAALAERLHVLAQMLPLPRRVPPVNLHLTLLFLGEVPAPLLAEAHLAFSTLRAAPFAIELAGLGLFGGDRPRSVHVAVRPEPRLDRLQARIETAARRAGLSPEARRFVPHVTLGRFRPHEADLPRLMAAVAAMGEPRFGPVEVTRFVLYRSHLGGETPHYEALADYPLAG